MSLGIEPDRSCPVPAPQVSSAASIDRRRGAAISPLRLPKSMRWSMGMVGLTMWSLLVVAFCLRPDPRGMGTHEQLGLPPCLFSVVCGFRCPSCGMTTSWAHLTHGQIDQALEASASGSLLACLALVGGGHLLASATMGRWVARWKNENAGAVLAATFGALVLIEWMIRLAVGR